MKIYKGLVLNDYGGKEDYASMVAAGEKKIETRMNRLFSFRGDVIICCGRTNSVTENAGFALCLVEIFAGRPMVVRDEPQAKIGWHPDRKALLLRNWRYFSRRFEFVPMALQRNFQGMFNMAIPEDVEIIPQPQIAPAIDYSRPPEDFIKFMSFTQLNLF